MTTYKEIFGKQIKFLSSDLSDASATGQIWYNSTAAKFKSIVAAEATSSAAPLNTTRAMCSGGGIQTAAFLCGGSTGAPTVGTTHTENYNGSGWATSASMSNPRAHFGATGTQTAGIAAGGGPPFAPSPGGAQSNTEEYNGSSWSEKSDMISNTGNTKDQCFGTNSDDMMVAGGPPNLATCIGWDGTAWSTRPSISTGRGGGAGAGASSTSGWIGGGQSPFKTATEEFNGETSALNIEDFTTS